MEKDLEKIRAWANDKIKAGQEPPWAWYQYMKLIETADALLAGMDCVTKENSRQSEQLSDKPIRLVESTDQQESAQPRPVGLPTQMPT